MHIMPKSAEVSQSIQVLTQSLMLCSGAAYWTGGAGGPGYIYSLGSGLGALKKFTLAGSTLTLNGVAAAVGNFTKWGGARLPETFLSLTVRQGGLLQVSTLTMHPVAS